MRVNLPDVVGRELGPVDIRDFRFCWFLILAPKEEARMLINQFMTSNE